jgi:phosphoglycerate dehydrogenase-like enzyme
MPPSQATADAVQRALPSDDVLEIRDIQELASSRAEVVLGGLQTDRVKELLESVPELRWYHTGADGVEPIVQLFRGRNVTLTNNRGAYVVPVAEHAIACILAITKHLHVYRDRQREVAWLRDLEHAEARGARMVVFGLGSIGTEIARLGNALGMLVTGVRRKAGPSADPSVERVVGPTELESVVGNADFLVVSAPGTAQTQRVISRAVIGRMKTTAWLINVARGTLVDEPALIEALQQGKIGGAALDVFETEPLPPSSPLWSLQNVIITPHRASHTLRMEDRTLSAFVENMHRYRAGEPLLHRVDPEEGY